MLLKIIKTYRDVVAMCDEELIGKKFEESNFQLDVKESFFRGERVSDDEAIRIIKEKKTEDATFNIVGEKSVKLALAAGIISESEIGRIKGIPFALVLI